MSLNTEQKISHLATENDQGELQLPQGRQRPVEMPPQPSAEQIFAVQLDLLTGVFLRGVHAAYNKVPPAFLAVCVAQTFGRHISGALASSDQAQLEELRNLLKVEFGKAIDAVPVTVSQAVKQGE